MGTPNNKNGSLLHDERGAAMVEATIMLPVLLLIFGSVMFMSKKYETAVQKQETARHCAWVHAKNNCEGDAPSGCSVSEGNDEMDTSPFTTDQDVQNASNNDDSGFLGDIMSFILGDATTATASGTVTAPNVLGGGNTNVSGRLALSCNEKVKHNLGEAISAAWDSLAGSL